jgi:uncharacterized coiled-coil protein SlyX
MAILPMGLSSDERSATQESMFGDPADFATTESQESVYDDPEELSYGSGDGAAEDFSEDASNAADLEPVSEPVAAISPSEPESQPTLVPFQPDLHESRVESPLVAATATDPAPMTVLTSDDFAALEERVLRAVGLVRREREARTAAEARVAELEAKLQAPNPVIEGLEQEVETLRVEREQVRQRVERLLGQLDALEL